jgi:choline monooxygenase
LNSKLATENTMEFYHLPWVHETLNSYSPTHAHYHCNAGDRFVGTATRDYRPSAAGELQLPKFPGLTAQRLHLCFVGDDAMRPEFTELHRAIVERWRAINLEDIGITERMQGGRHSPAFDGGRMSPVQDFAIHHFMKMVAARLAE